MMTLARAAEHNIVDRNLFYRLLPLTKRVGISLLIWVSLAGAIFYAMVKYDEVAFRKHLVQEQARLDRSVASSYQRVLRQVDALGVMLDLADEYQNAVMNGDNSSMKQALEAIARRSVLGVFQVASMDSHAVVSWATGIKPRIGYSIADREHFQAIANGHQGIFVSKPVIGRSSGQWSIQFTRGFRDATGLLKSVQVVSVSPPALVKSIVPDEDSGPGIVGLARRLDGALLAQSEALNDLLQNHGVLDLSGHIRKQGAGEAVRISRSPVSNDDILIATLAVPNLDIVVYKYRSVRDLRAEAVRGARSRSIPIASISILVLLLLLLAGNLLHIRRRFAANLIRVEQQREAELQAREKIESLLSRLPGVVFAGDLDNHSVHFFHFQSRNIASVMGQSVQSKTDLNDIQSFLSGAISNFDEFLDQSLEMGGGSRDFAWNRPDGSMGTYSLRIYCPEMDGRFVGLINDVTQERSVARQLVQNEKLSTLGQLATSMAHELNQPLSTISFAAENSRMDVEQGDHVSAIKRLTVITDQVMRARCLIDHLRIFGRNDDGDPAPTSMVSVIEGVRIIAGPILRNSGTELNTNINNTFPPVLGRQIKLEQILLNLIQNGCDAMEEKADKKILTINGRIEQDNVVLTVSDEGAGIPPAILKSIFQPFFTTKDMNRGTGLGLSISREMIESFGGTIDAANRKGGGAIFTIRLKRALVAAMV